VFNGIFQELKCTNDKQHLDVLTGKSFSKASVANNYNGGIS